MKITSHLRVNFPNGITGFIESVEFTFPDDDTANTFKSRAAALPNGDFLDFVGPWSEVLYETPDEAGIALAKALERGLE